MPITPVFEQPPVARPRNALDWTEQLDALVAHPGDWAKVDGPLNPKTGHCQSRERSLVKFAQAAEVDIEATHRTIDGEQWIYARTATKAAAKPAAKPKPSPVAAVPPPSPIHDDGTHAHQCDTCGDAFRTNTRLRQHQANAHKAS